MNLWEPDERACDGTTDIDGDAETLVVLSDDEPLPPFVCRLLLTRNPFGRMVSAIISRKIEAPIVITPRGTILTPSRPGASTQTAL
jgi:hypothetical protein